MPLEDKDAAYLWDMLQAAREIIGQRNILAHEYGRIDHEILYKTAVQDIPALIHVLEKALPPIQ